MPMPLDDLWLAELETGSSQVVTVPLGSTLCIEQVTTQAPEKGDGGGLISVRCSVQGQEVPMCTLQGSGETRTLRFILPEGYAAELRIDWLDTLRELRNTAAPSAAAPTLGRTPASVTITGNLISSAPCLPVLDTDGDASRHALDGPPAAVAEALGSLPATPSTTPKAPTPAAPRAKAAAGPKGAAPAKGGLPKAATATAGAARAVPGGDDDMRDDDDEGDEARVTQGKAVGMEEDEDPVTGAQSQVDEATPGEPVAAPVKTVRMADSVKEPRRSPKRRPEEDSDVTIEIEKLHKLPSNWALLTEEEKKEATRRIREGEPYNSSDEEDESIDSECVDTGFPDGFGFTDEDFEDGDDSSDGNGMFDFSMFAGHAAPKKKPASGKSKKGAKAKGKPASKKPAPKQAKKTNVKEGNKPVSGGSQKKSAKQDQNKARRQAKQAGQKWKK